MAGPGQIPGRYNLIIEDKYDTFDHQIPVEEEPNPAATDDDTRTTVKTNTTDQSGGDQSASTDD